MSTIFKALRKSAGVTQAELAKKAGLYQANISEIENGLVDPSFSTVERYIARLGYQLVPVPTRTPSVITFCKEFEDAIAEKDENWAIRAVIQLNDNLNREPAPIISALSLAEPAPVGDKRFDALIAGVVEYHLIKKSAEIPEWLSKPNRYLAEKWTIDKWAGKNDQLEFRTPACIKKRNILFAESELLSV
jgi:transcriptional regulator with XRE-family HTH domain